MSPLTVKWNNKRFKILFGKTIPSLTVIFEKCIFKKKSNRQRFRSPDVYFLCVTFKTFWLQGIIFRCRVVLRTNLCSSRYRWCFFHNFFSKPIIMAFGLCNSRVILTISRERHLKILSFKSCK